MKTLVLYSLHDPIPDEVAELFRLEDEGGADIASVWDFADADIYTLTGVIIATYFRVDHSACCPKWAAEIQQQWEPCQGWREPLWKIIYDFRNPPRVALMMPCLAA